MAIARSTILTFAMRQPLLVLLALATVFAAGTNAQVIDWVDPFPNLSFSNPLDFQYADDGTNILYVAEQIGIIHSFENDTLTTSTTTFLDIAERVHASGGQGLFGLAFHPNHETNGFFYVDYITADEHSTRLSRFSRSTTNPDVADPNSEVVLIEISQPFQDHNMGNIAFGPDGYLYVPLGDGGSGDQQNNGQRLDTLLGSMLRLDVDGGGDPLDCGLGTGSATIPGDNPFVDGAGGNCD